LPVSPVVANLGEEMRLLRKFPFTTLAAVLVTVFLLVVILVDVDLNLPLSRIKRIAEVVASLVLVLVAFSADLLAEKRRQRFEAELQAQRHEAELQAQKLRTFKATLRTVQHIVNNSLNGLQVIRQEAEDVLSPNCLKLFDLLIREAAEELTLLGNLESIDERNMGIGTGIAYEGPHGAEK
jgi:hypothetical protein